jgi:hypothetical protein
MEYEQFLSSINMDDKQVIQRMSELPDPVTPAGKWVYPIFSDIQGIGLASGENIEEGMVVMLLLKDGIRHVGARYTNHSANPNAKAVISGKILVAVATRDIDLGEEITMCYAKNLEATKEYKHE